MHLQRLTSGAMQIHSIEMLDDFEPIGKYASA